MDDAGGAIGYFMSALLVDLFLQGRFALDAFVSERIGLDDVEEAFHRMERGEVLRSVVVLDGGASS